MAQGSSTLSPKRQRPRDRKTSARRRRRTRPLQGTVRAVRLSARRRVAGWNGILRDPHDRGIANGLAVPRVSPASVRESHPHDIAITQEAPNYSTEYPAANRRDTNPAYFALFAILIGVGFASEVRADEPPPAPLQIGDLGDAPLPALRPATDDFREISAEPLKAAERLPAFNNDAGAPPQRCEMLERGQSGFAIKKWNSCANAARDR